MKIGYIYETKNKENGKVYIGKCKGKFYLSYHGSGKIIKQAIKKYGEKSFITRLIDQAETKDRLNKMEKAYIAAYRMIYGKENVYNIGEGGEGGIGRLKGYKHTQESKEKIRFAQIGKIVSEETKNRQSKAHLKHKKDCKCLCCNVRRGEYKSSEKTNMKISTTQKERIHKINCKCWICRARKGEYKGKNNPFFGGHHTEKVKEINRQIHLGKITRKETREKQRQSSLEREWINNQVLKQEKFVKRNLIQLFLNDGWILGRLKRCVLV